MKTINAKPGRRSMALVVTLVLVTLTSALVVAFAMRARLDLAASSSFAATPQADGIARAGVELIARWFHRQIIDGSDGYNASGNPASGDDAVVFRPLTDANALPQRMARKGGGSGGDNYQSLIAMSKRGTPFFAAGDGWQFNGGETLDVASDVSTKEGSANGRRFGASRWLAPGLMTTEEAADFDDKTAREDVLPDWIYVTRQGPERLMEAGDQQRNEDPENLNFVLGRFAYTIYDVSGLLDIGIAGYPGSMGDYGIVAKNSLAWANPGAMSLPSGNGINRQALVDWRNRASKGDFVGYVTNAIKHGFQTNAAGDNAFFGRGDLVGFAKAEATRSIFDTNALPYLTAFSREKAAPSWWPRIPDSVKSRVTVDYEDEAFEENSTNRWTAAVMVKKDFTAPDGTEFSAGDPSANKPPDPLLKRRFALSRINMLRRDSGVDADTIWYYFGLVKRGDAGRGSGINEWVYNPDSTSPTEKSEKIFYTLDKIAEKGREPNFFELINAGILHGSMGKSGYREGMDLRLGRDRSVYHQVLQIGANIIDQYDTDSDPTIIRSISDEATKQGYHNTVNLLASTIRGIENLPYIDEFLTTFMRDRSKGPPGGGQIWVQPPIYPGDNMDNRVPFVTYFFQFELWNPHRNAKDAKQSRYRLIAQTGNTYLDYRPYLAGNNRNTGGGSPDIRKLGGQEEGQDVTYNDLFYEAVRLQFPMQQYGRDFARNPCIMEFSAGKRGAFFDIPKLLRYDDPDLEMRVVNELDTYKKLQASITGLRLGDCLVVKNLDLDDNPNNDFEWFAWDSSLGRWVHRDNHIYPWFLGNQPLVIELQKQSETTGGWFTYQVFSPRKTGTQLSGVPGFDHSAYCWAYKPIHDNLYGRRWPVAHSFNPVSDPRCQRYGFTHGGGIGTGTYEYEKAVGATLRDAPKDAHRALSDFEGKEGDSTRIQYKTYRENSPGWQFPAWIAPYSANPNEKDWTSPLNKIDLDKDTLWFWYKFVNGVGTPYYQTAVAEFAENNDAKGRMGSPISMMFSRDWDGLVRRGDSWRGRNVNPFSMQMNAEDNVGRPVFVNRPFQSVGELGYVLRDDPWKTLNLFWGDSADCGLLDLFCLDEGNTYTPVRAGVVNPNTAPKEVLAAVLSGTALHGQVMGNDPQRLDDSGAAQIAEAIREYIGPTSNPKKILRNIGDIAELCEEIFEEGSGASALQDMRNTDIGREAVARALADVANTRTWNLFVDIVAQAGRFTEASREPKDFVVRGERRFWVHLALDRFTGQLVDVNIEPVFE